MSSASRTQYKPIDQMVANKGAATTIPPDSFSTPNVTTFRHVSATATAYHSIRAEFANISAALTNADKSTV
jgi:hypothetical protein